MAQPVSDEGSLSQAAAPGSKNGGSKPASRAATPTAKMSPAVASSSFQAINHRPAIENARIGSPATNQQRGTPSDLTPPARESAVAQEAPQTAQTSGSASTSQPTSKLSSQGENLDSNMDATYGTRSRNRTNARPNYAEDQEMDFEMSSNAKKKTAELTSQGGSEATISSHATNGNTGKGPVPAVKDGTPSTSSGVNANPMRKRKAAAAAPASTLHTPAMSSTPPPSALRKGVPLPTSASAAASATARETNIMTFGKSRSLLNKKGELVADDGTKLNVNGKQCSPGVCDCRLQRLPRFELRITFAITEANIIR